MNTPNSSSPSLATLTLCAATAVTSITCTCAFWYIFHKKTVQKAVNKLTNERQAERRGRIRAEVQLRTLLKEGRSSQAAVGNGVAETSDKSAQGEEEMSASLGSNGSVKKDSIGGAHAKWLTMVQIGTIVSPFTKRMGTPRQGTLVPSGRGLVEMHCPMECVDGVEAYSHLWIIFHFHANTDLGQFKAKIRPPRAGGKKVGYLSTRSPHRQNPIGLTLVKLDGVDRSNKQLRISGLDLVNGTPVYDIKPCVPWDIPGHNNTAQLSVPEWVGGDDDVFSSVEFVPPALESLEASLKNGYLQPLYDTSGDGLDAAVRTISEVVQQDPRASYRRGKDTGSTSSGASTSAQDLEPYRMVFCSVQVEFVVKEMSAKVVAVTPMHLEGATFVDGIPLVAEGGILLDPP